MNKILSDANIQERYNAAKYGYRVSNPGSCDAQREAAVVDVIALISSHRALAAQLAQVQKERDRFVKLVTFLVETGRKWDGYTIDYKDANRILGREPIHSNDSTA